MFNEETKEKEKREMKVKCRVLSVHTKRHNKWFMTLDKQPQNQFMKQDDLKKCRCAVRIIIDRVFEGHEDMTLNLDEWPSKHACKLASGLDVANVHNGIFNY